MELLDPTNPRPLYLQLADHLRNQIIAGTLKPNERLATEAELSATLAISRGTIRQALDLLVSQGLIQRIPAKGTFVLSADEKPQTQLIGFIVPYLRDTLTNEMLSGAERVLRQSGYSLIFCHSENDLELERTQIQRLQREGISGLILFPIATAEEGALLHNILPQQFPLVLIDRQVPGLQASCVVADNEGGARHVVAHLLEQGQRRIVCVRPNTQASSVEERVYGYEQALYAAGIMPLAAVAVAHSKQAPAESLPGYSSIDLAPLEQALQVQDPPTALFCINDFIAISVMQYLRDRGLRIPHDIAVAGFDDTPMARYLPEPLTTVAQPTYDIGAQAAHILLDHITGVTAPGQQLILPTTLIVRTSTQR